jgi:hypothetical protein
MANKAIYKRWWFWLLCLLVIILLVKACSGDQPTPAPTPSPNTSTPQTSPQEEYKLNDEVKAGNIAYIVSEVKKSTKIGQNEYLQKTTENEYLIVKVKVTNNDKDTRTVDTNLFKLKDAEGKEYSAMADADLYVNPNNSFFLAQVNPGTSKSGYIVFEIPKNLKDLKLQVSSGLGWTGGQYKIINLGQ